MGARLLDQGVKYLTLERVNLRDLRNLALNILFLFLQDGWEITRN